LFLDGKLDVNLPDVSDFESLQEYIIWWDNTEQLGRRAIDELSQCRRLTGVRFDIDNVDTISRVYTELLQQGHQLQGLKQVGPLRDVGASLITSLPSTLRCLHAANFTDSGLCALGDLTHLQELIINHLTHPQLMLLTKFAPASLESLELHNVFIDDEALALLLRTTLVQVRSMYFVNVELQSLEAFATPNQLHSLSLSAHVHQPHPRFAPQELMHIVAGCRQLRSLAIDGVTSEPLNKSFLALLRPPSMLLPSLKRFSM